MHHVAFCAPAVWVQIGADLFHLPNQLLLLFLILNIVVFTTIVTLLVLSFWHMWERPYIHSQHFNHPYAHRASRPPLTQRNFSCADRVWGQSVTERGLWALLSQAGCHHLVPGLWLLAALDMVGCACVCLGGYLYSPMPPIWGWTAVHQ